MEISATVMQTTQRNRAQPTDERIGCCSAAPPPVSTAPLMLHKARLTLPLPHRLPLIVKTGGNTRIDWTLRGVLDSTSGPLQPVEDAVACTPAQHELNSSQRQHKKSQI